ncbi:hypothetical protein FD05_GL000950 [Lentilactobacillus otakiensis DSM 19908 = JCM 15040]|uniref:GW domain-containing protein n=1 Tax=Lentilactobacillus otakiensis DSM 19908 = JCM 15040 TaxID=1423780 RepID=S4NP31_9LACO|nr:hypothetical protein [Lentilactobacillus otakiensis]KRL09962.1 hypothetical protein FD05_GL000950 [Lentilactobacillus otakiensis DSM 19908 = JCM 15040]MBZ3776266.1 hypothetical protein [Lentilactobacillus otakiensis]MDV3517310.1 hypothetical protein [Lentilactobacillus otakiensis]GAD17561.1 hypothetical protein LOT_2099 [Lentilactobacillus otakiensis DSM 19908 = JCM 15040]
MKLKTIIAGIVVATSFASISLPSAQVSAKSAVQQLRDAAKKSDKEAHEQGFGNHRGGKLGKQPAAKVLSNKKVTPRTAYLAYGGNIYSDQYLSYSKAYVVKYVGPKFSINRQEVVLKANGKKAVYYHVTNSQITGWVWHKNTIAHLS